MSVRKALLNAIRHVSTQMDHTIVHVYVVTSVMISQNVKVILGKKPALFIFITYHIYSTYFYLSKDIDECSTLPNGLCQQNCINTLGTYFCECRDGFRSVGQYLCEGKVSLYVYIL